MLSPSLEDYLEEIYRFSLDNKTVRVSDIANCLEVTMPSVNNAIRRLSIEGYLIYEKYQDLLLTSKGEKLGYFLVERNRILQDFLILLNSKCDIGREAEAMEHYLSLPTIKVIEHLIAFMQVNPDCYTQFLKHSYIREKQNIGLVDGYSNQP
ncbi:MAG TPA: iron dependent repressor, metal binding and dimerization domain protein [Syntrophomonadaceae bacterium]|nr:iron dependent repressor, metal binding and dimerization domain protein [Syntrophomonadaceae bacterium]